MPLRLFLLSPQKLRFAGGPKWGLVDAAQGGWVKVFSAGTEGELPRRGKRGRPGARPAENDLIFFFRRRRKNRGNRRFPLDPLPADAGMVDILRAALAAVFQEES